MPRDTPYGYEADVIEGDGGWAAWDPEKGCPSCNAKLDEYETPLFALQCPVCEEVGCDECFPMGRGCPCPNCDDY